MQTKAHIKSKSYAVIPAIIIVTFSTFLLTCFKYTLTLRITIEQSNTKDIKAEQLNKIIKKILFLFVSFCFGKTSVSCWLSTFVIAELSFSSLDKIYYNSIPKYSQIAIRFLKSGVASPNSHLDIVCLATPNL